MVKGHIMILHTYTTQSMTNAEMNFLQLTVSVTWPRRDFEGQSQNSKVKDQIKVTP